MSQAAPTSPTARPFRASTRSLVKLAAGSLIVATVVPVFAQQAWFLASEIHDLRADEARVRATEPVGYPGISPRMSAARFPDPYYFHEHDRSRLWGHWAEGQGHRWFVLGRGELASDRLSLPFGRDLFQAIDAPLTEHVGGTIWGRIPDEARVAVSRLAGIETVYPLLLLEKVMIVNDTVADRPFLVVNNPGLPEDRRAVVYDPVLEGRRISLGSAGYLYEDKPMLYDRGTESLWVADAHAVHAVAGRHKGKRLPALAQPDVVAWSDWKTDHPAARLVIGADRSSPVAVR